MNRYALLCPRCSGLVQYGRWEIITLLDDRSQIAAWRGRWVPSKELVCPTPEHGVFERYTGKR